MIIQKRILLAIDWTNILFRSLFMSSTFGNDSYDTEGELQSFICKFGQDLAYLFKIFSPDKVVIAVDSKNPWRKDLLPHDEHGYKANRERNDKWDWDKIFEYSRKLKDVMIDKGFDFLECERTEADDLLCLVKETVSEKHKDEWNIIIVSSDADIRQLISFDTDNNQYCCVYNPVALKGGIRRLFVCKDFFDWYIAPETASNDIFFTNYNNDKNRIKNVLNGAGNKIKIEIIDPAEVVLSKIFCGDAGDNVPSFYNWYSKSGKKSRITELKWSKIKEGLAIKSVEDLEIKKPLLKESIEDVIKFKINDIDVSERLDRQRLLVELKSENFPKFIQTYKVDVNMILDEEIKIVPNKYNIHELFKNSELESFLQKKDKAEQAVFKELDKYVTTNNLSALW